MTKTKKTTTPKPRHPIVTPRQFARSRGIFLLVEGGNSSWWRALFLDPKGEDFIIGLGRLAEDGSTFTRTHPLGTSEALHFIGDKIMSPDGFYHVSIHGAGGLLYLLGNVLKGVTLVPPPSKQSEGGTR